MDKNTTIVYVADPNYFELERGLKFSIKEKPGGRDISISVLDLGFTNDQLDWMRKHAAASESSDWHFEFLDRDRVPGRIGNCGVRQLGWPSTGEPSAVADFPTCKFFGGTNRAQLRRVLRSRAGHILSGLLHWFCALAKSLVDESPAGWWNRTGRWVLFILQDLASRTCPGPRKRWEVRSSQRNSDTNWHHFGFSKGNPMLRDWSISGP